MYYVHSLSSRTTVYSCSFSKSSICFTNRSLSGIRSCSKITDPGVRRFRIRRSICSGAGCCVSSVRIFHPMEVYPNCRTAFAMVGLVTPNGGRNKVTGCEVTCSSSDWQVCKVFFHFREDRLETGPSAYKEWLPIRWPSAIICCSSFSFPFICFPIQKKQAFT